jgi:ribonucleoside-diphosphate reductase beta chain
MKIIGYEPIFDKVQNPISWINVWTGGSTQVQNAPQETEIDSYTIGAFKQDVDEESYDEFSF